MAFTAYPLVATSDVWTASDHNTYNRANINELWAYTTAGDMVYASSPTALSRIPVGSTGQVLTISGGVPVWSTGAPGIFEAEGDLLYGTGASAMARLARGDNDDILSLIRGVPGWRYSISPLSTSAKTGDSFLDSVSVSEGVLTSIPCAADDAFDDSGWHSTTVNNTRITVSDAGRYLCSVSYYSYSSYLTTQEEANLYLAVNGTNLYTIAIDKKVAYSNSGFFVLDLDANDYVEVKVLHTNSNSSARINFAVLSFLLSRWSY